MRSMVGPRVSGKDSFGREAEMAALRQLVQDGNHILLTGQRRMGKTSIAWELGERLSEEENWLFLPVDVEQATSSEDVVTLLYDEYRLKTMRSRAARLAVGLGDVARNVQEVGLRQMRVKFRKGLTAGNWARHGNDLLRKCARQKRRVLIVVDELPIFLSRRRGKDGRRQADEFMSWLRQGFQTVQGQAPPVLIVSGSIGLKPLVDRLGLSDRINYLHPFRLGPWSRETSIACIEELANSDGIALDEGVAEAMYGRLGLGIPHHVQSFFAYLRMDATLRGAGRLTVDDVERIYHEVLLGPDGQNDLMHYESRLQDHLADAEYDIAKDILTEAATQGVFTAAARRSMEATMDSGAPARIASVLDILTHDGYLASTDDRYEFASAFIRDWWRIRFSRGYVPLAQRLGAA